MAKNADPDFTCLESYCGSERSASFKPRKARTPISRCRVSSLNFIFQRTLLLYGCSEENFVIPDELWRDHTISSRRDAILSRLYGSLLFIAKERNDRILCIDLRSRFGKLLFDLAVSDKPCTKVARCTEFHCPRHRHLPEIRNVNELACAC